MRIAMIGSRGAGSNYGGIERMLEELCPRLAALGHCVDVFSRVGVVSDDGNGLRAIPVASFGGKHFENLTRSAIATGRTIGRYDVLHFHAVGPGILSVAARVWRQSSVVTIHGLDHKREKWGPLAKLSLRLAEHALTLSADQVTVVSKPLGRYFRERHDIPVRFIPNGMPEKVTVPPGDVLRRYGLEADGYYLFGSRLTPEKGCHDLIAAFNRLETGRKLAIAGGVGATDYIDALKRQADPAKVVFLGHRSADDMAELFSNAHLFVLPSYIEGMSMALLEALAFGTPALVSDIEENLTVVGDAAFRFKTASVEDLWRVLSDIEGSPMLRADMLKRINAIRHVDWDAAAQQYDAVYRSVVTTRAALVLTNRVGQQP